MGGAVIAPEDAPQATFVILPDKPTEVCVEGLHGIFPRPDIAVADATDINRRNRGKAQTAPPLRDEALLPPLGTPVDRCRTNHPTCLVQAHPHVPAQHLPLQAEDRVVPGLLVIGRVRARPAYSLALHREDGISLRTSIQTLH